MSKKATSEELEQRIRELEKAESERKRVENKLIESEIRYRALFENMNAGFVLFEVVQNDKGDPIDLIVVSANKGFETTTGLNLQNAIGKRLTKALPGIENDAADWIGTYGKIALTGEARQFEQGSELLGYYYAINAYQAGPKLCAVTFLDITERKRAEETLKVREHRLLNENEALLSLMSQGILFHSDLDQAVKTITETCSELIQTERVSIWEYSEDDSTIRCIDAYQRSKKQHNQGESLRSEDFPSYTKSHKLGQVIAAVDVRTDPRTREIPTSYWDEHDIYSLVDAPIWLHGRVGGLLSFEHTGEQRQWSQEDERLCSTIATLVTVCFEANERKKAEEALQKSEERMRTMFNDAPLGIALVDSLTGQLYEVNPRYAEIAGRTIEEMATIDWMSITHPDDVQKDQDNMARLNAGEITGFNIQKRYIKPDESVIWIRMTVAPVKVDDTTRPKHLAMIEDITDLKQAEIEKEKLESQLRQAQKMEAVGRLAGGVAHDYNNMLSVIHGYTELALEKIDPDYPLHADLEEIQAAARRSIDITRQLLAFSRKQNIAPTTFDLNETIEGMLRMLRRLIGEDIDLVWHPGSRLWPVYMDPSQLDQILVNLCINARDAIKDVGKITLETNTKRFDEYYCQNHLGFRPGSFVMIAISDDGYGMDKQTQSRLFEPFFTTKEMGKGTGLGLATVYGIVKQNGGFINVYSELGQGTTFRIYLPKHEATVKKTTEKKCAQPDSRGNETILLVEDEPTILKMTKMILERLGYNVLTTSKPIEAIDMALSNSEKIHLMITDVVMPEMNGRELSSRLNEIYPNLKTLFMSGYTANVIAHRGILDDGINFIQKPFSKQDLAVKVREALDRG